MKQLLLFVAFLIVMISPFGVSAQLDNMTNMSAKWIRSDARNAALEGTDIVNYNPAGLVKLNDGFHISLNNQSLFRYPQHSFDLGLGSGKQTYKQGGPDLLLPSIYAAYKRGKWALSSAIYITGGGASAYFPDGSVNTNLIGYRFMTLTNATYGTGYTSLKDQYLKASSYYLAIPVSFSYSITDKLSLSIGGRYVIANNHNKASLILAGSTVSAPDSPISIDYKNKASGYGGIIGLNYSVNDKLNFAFHYESRVKLEFEAEDNKGTVKSYIPDGKKTNRDLPAVLYTGASYKLNDKLIAAIDFNYYFQKGANWGKTIDASVNDTLETSDLAGNAFHVALSFDYQLLPKLQVSIGGKYLHFNYDDLELYYTQLGAYEVVKYDNIYIGLGAGYSITEKIKIDFGVGRIFWNDKKIKAENWPTKPDVNVSSKAYDVAIGLDISF